MHAELFMPDHSCSCDIVIYDAAIIAGTRKSVQRTEEIVAVAFQHCVCGASMTL